MRRVLLAAFVLLMLGPAARADDVGSLERGYRLMYGLDFRAARDEFLMWEHDHPRDPLGPMSVAANILFAELDRAGTLQAQFFVDDGSFRSRKGDRPVARQEGTNPALRASFNSALADAETWAGERLERDGRDRDALFALTMVYGLRADYAALVERRNLASLSYTRQATTHARQLLAIAPDCADAYLATGISQYIIGSLSAPFRWVLRIAGYDGDKAAGLHDLQVTAERGRLLGPFARILLSIAYLREHDPVRARQLLTGLARDFPSNPLFARELKRLDGRGD